MRGPDLADYRSAAAMSQRLRMICKICDSGRGVHVPEKEGNVASPSGHDWGHRALFSEWYSIPGAAFALMPLPLVIQYRVKARKLTIRPSQRICVRASRPGLNEIPFQLV